MPWTGTTDTSVQITNGVYQITTDFTIPGLDRRVVEDAVEIQAANELGSLRAQFDYGTLCMMNESMNDQT